jgi:hypothetical protein
MKSFYKITGLAFLLSVLFHGCDIDGDNNARILTIYAAFPDKNESFNCLPCPEFPIENAEVFIYPTFEDYTANKNAVAHGLTDTAGIFTVAGRKDRSYWVRIVKDQFNNRRFDSVEYSPASPYLMAPLSTTPTKLQVDVRDDDGAPVVGALVKLYFSEDEHKKNGDPYKNKNEIKYYGHCKGEPCVSREGTFEANTNHEGTAYFDNLEPKQYWIRVMKGKKSNERGVIKTSTTLPDDPEATTMVRIDIK